MRLLRFGRVDGGLPEILSGEELVGAGHVVFGQQFALHLEQAFRISHVAHQVAGDFRQLVVLAGEDLLPGFDDRVGLVPYIQVHGTVVCVHGGFHGIADVVGVLRVQAAYRVGGFRGGVLGGLAQVGHLRVWVGVRSGVAVHDPLDPSVHHGRVYAAVKRQIRRDFGHTFLRGTVVENLRIGVHTVGEQDLVGAEADGVQQSGEDVADLRTAIALEGVGGAFRTGRIVEFPGFGAFRSAYDRIFGGVRREVDARLVLFGIGELALGGDARFEELRLAVGGHLVAVGGHNAIAVRVHGVVVDPVAVVETVQIEFARGDHRVLADAVDVVFVDRDGVGERVVLLGLLQLFERRGDDLRVEQADLSGGFRGIGQCAFLAFGGGLVLFGLHLVQAVRGAGGVDVALDIGGFHFLRVRIDAEALQQHRPGHGKHQAHHDGGGDGHGRHLPRLERFGSTCRDGCGTFQRMGFHNPQAQYHAKDGGDGGHDERDGDGGVHRGVGGAGDSAAFLGQVREHAQNLIGGPGEHVEHQPDADLAAGAFGDAEQAMAVHRHGDADAAHKHVGDDGEDDASEQQQRDSGHDEFQSGQHEHVEAVVDAELRILGAEALRVEHEQDFGPVRVELGAEHQSDNQGDDHGDASSALGAHALADFDGVAVHADGGAVRSVGTRPYRQRGGDEADCGDEHRVRQPEADPGAQLRPNHALEAELAVPHDIGDELREREEQSDDDGERQHHADEDLAAVRRFARTVRLAGDAGARRSFRGNVRRWLRTVPSVGFDVEDDRIVVAGFARILPAGTVRAAFGIEHGTKHIKERHANSLATGEERR